MYVCMYVYAHISMARMYVCNGTFSYMYDTQDLLEEWYALYSGGKALGTDK